MPNHESDFRSPKRGDTIADKYVVDGQLGRGGMGRVLKVHHKDLGHYFAMKVPKKSYARSDSDKNNFFREALLASSVNHQNICNVFDYGQCNQFGLFMVMEYVEGQNLRKKLQHDGGMSSKVAVDIMLQVSNAIAFVHEKSILHGDIKSENILMSRGHDGRRHMKLLDFGLARQLNVDTGRVQGTPQYLAPERIQGSPRTECADVYALGILFYELIAGVVPFQGNIEDVMHAHLHEEIPAASLLSKKSIDERVDTIIEKATKKNPEHRYPRADALFYELKTLSNMLGNKPTKKRTTRRSTPSLIFKQPSPTCEHILRTLPLPCIAFNTQKEPIFSNQAFDSQSLKPKSFEAFANRFIESEKLLTLFASLFKKEGSTRLVVKSLDTGKRQTLHMNSSHLKEPHTPKDLCVTCVMTPET